MKHSGDLQTCTHCDHGQISIPKPQFLHLQHRAKNTLDTETGDCRELSLEIPHSAVWDLRLIKEL